MVIVIFGLVFIVSIFCIDVIWKLFLFLVFKILVFSELKKLFSMEFFLFFIFREILGVR